MSTDRAFVPMTADVPSLRSWLGHERAATMRAVDEVLARAERAASSARTAGDASGPAARGVALASAELASLLPYGDALAALLDELATQVAGGHWGNVDELLPSLRRCRDGVVLAMQDDSDSPASQVDQVEGELLRLAAAEDRRIAATAARAAIPTTLLGFLNSG